MGISNKSLGDADVACLHVIISRSVTLYLSCISESFEEIKKKNDAQAPSPEILI